MTTIWVSSPLNREGGQYVQPNREHDWASEAVRWDRVKERVRETERSKTHTLGSFPITNPNPICEQITDSTSHTGEKNKEWSSSNEKKRHRVRFRDMGIHIVVHVCYLHLNPRRDPKATHHHARCHQPFKLREKPSNGEREGREVHLPCRWHYIGSQEADVDRDLAMATRGRVTAAAMLQERWCEVGNSLMWSLASGWFIGDEARR